MLFPALFTAFALFRPSESPVGTFVRASVFLAGRVWPFTGLLLHPDWTQSIHNEIKINTFDERIVTDLVKNCNIV